MYPVNHLEHYLFQWTLSDDQRKRIRRVDAILDLLQVSAEVALLILKECLKAIQKKVVLEGRPVVFESLDELHDLPPDIEIPVHRDTIPGKDLGNGVTDPAEKFEYLGDVGMPDEPPSYGKKKLL